MPLSINDFTSSSNPDWHEVFKCAATFINQRGGQVSLHIPSSATLLGGVYTVGKQYPKPPPDAQLRKGETVFELHGVHDVEIFGDFDAVSNKPTTIIQYNGNLLFRAIDASGLVIDPLPTSNAYLAADLGNGLVIDECTNVKIENITMDGNVIQGGVDVGGDYTDGSHANQLIHYLIWICNSFGTVINRVECIRSGLDGIRIKNNNADAANPCNTLISNTKCLFNTRQGMTITTGHGIRVENCNFDNTGKGDIHASPNAGCDIETDNEGDVSNVTFTNCTFDNNRGNGLVSWGVNDPNDNKNHISKVNLNSCRLVGFSALEHYRDEFKFNNCQIMNGVLGCRGDISNPPTLATQFNACMFSDCSYYYQRYGNQNIPLSYPVYNNVHSIDNGAYDIYMVEADNVKFNKCHFDNFYGKKASINSTLTAPHSIECNNSYFANFTTFMETYNVYGFLLQDCVFEMRSWDIGHPTHPCQNQEPLFGGWNTMVTPPSLIPLDCSGTNPTRTCTSYENAHPNFCYNPDFFRGTNQIYINNLSASDIGGNHYSNAYFFVNGTFTIDKNMTFENCHFFFTAGAQVVVNDNKLISMSNCELRGGCNACWNGFVATDYFNQVVLNNCVINDMQPIGFAENITNLTSSQLITSNNNSSVLSNKNYFIYNNFDIDQNITFDHCHFYVAPGGNITLSNNAILTLTHCQLRAACGGMWNGIIADNASEQIISDGSFYYDMRDGIQLRSNAKATLINNKFDSNLEGVKIYGNTDPANLIIKSNVFKFTSTSLLPPYQNDKPHHGIYIENSSEVNIGESTNYNGNHFENLWNGITAITDLVQDPSSLTLPQYPYNSNSKIRLYNNTFYNIQVEQPLSDGKGSGIFIHRANPTHVLEAEVWSNPIIQTQGFNNCTYGIHGIRSSLKVNNQRIKNTSYGIVASEADGQKIRVQDNILQDVYWGITKNGDEAINGFEVYYNNITLPEGDESTPFSAFPIGIYSAYSSNNHVGASSIKNNTINIPKGNTGVGISVYKGLKDNVTNNEVHFTTPNVNMNLTMPKMIKMIGIYADQSEGINIAKNTVDNGGGTNYVHTVNTGVYLIDSKESQLICNALNYTKFGILAVGKNGSTTHYDRTRGNFMNNSDANVLFWKLTQEGTLGQIGLNDVVMKYDGNNEFLKPNNAFLNHVFRVTDCFNPFSDEIVTTFAKLDQSKSSGSNTNNPNLCNTIVTNPPTFTNTYTCPTIGGGNNLLSLDALVFDANHAMEVANNSIAYSEYIDGARRMDEEMVMNWLENNATARSEYPILNSYYLAHHAGIVGQLNDVDRKISLLNDSTLRSTPEQWMVKYNEAYTLNNTLGGTEIFEQNAKKMNSLYLKSLLNGSFALNETEESEIETLAFTCPYVGGNAVFRARVLHGMKHFGIHYDDLEICNGQGVYRGGMSKLQEQLNALNNPIPNQKSTVRIITDDMAYIYPNPAVSSITVGCKNGKEIIIFDLFGSAVLKHKLDNTLIENKVDVSSLNKGIYLYKVLNRKNEVYNGKLTID